MAHCRSRHTQVRIRAWEKKKGFQISLWDFGHSEEGLSCLHPGARTRHLRFPAPNKALVLIVLRPHPRIVLEQSRKPPFKLSPYTD